MGRVAHMARKRRLAAPISLCYVLAMFGMLRARWMGLSLTLALLVALGASGFAHQAPSGPADPERLAWAAFWGEASGDLCATGDAGGGHVGLECAACILAATALCPTPFQSHLAMAPQRAAPVPIPNTHTQCDRTLNICAPVRAPPSV